jgi:alkylated DNA repair dioxygenase AlkB
VSQLDIFSIEENRLKPMIIRNGAYIYIPNYFNNELSEAYLKNLLDDIQWRQEEMKIYGRQIKFPRLTSWYGDSNKPYTFSGITLNPNVWTKELLEIKNKIELQFNIAFNSVLLNLYRDGSDSISWHTDAEKELGQNPIIASVNFGATRKFQLRHKETKERIDINLENGSLLIMQGELQHYWQHQIPKTKKDIGQRINLTFRFIK